MPTVPKKTELKATAADVVNSIASEIDPSGRIPTVLNMGARTITGGIATREYALQTLRDAGTTIVNHQPFANAFLSALTNRIARVIITSRLYRNPWESFKRGTIEYGETIEEIFVNIIEAHNFDPERAQSEIFKREFPDVRSAFHTMNYQKFYKVTVTQAELRQAFLSFEGVNNLVNKIIEAVYTSANFDEFLVMKYLIGLRASIGSMYPVNIPAISASTSNEVATILKTVSDNLTFMSSAYNEAGVFNHSSKDRQIFIMSTEFANTLDVESLAVAFNLSKVELMGRIIRVNSFGFSSQELARLNNLLENNPNYAPITSAQNTLLSNIPAVVVDRDYFMIFDNLTSMDEQRNGEGLYWNYWYHQWKTFSVSPFANSIIFTDATPAITSVTVTPGAAAAAQGSLVTFNVNVQVTGFASGQVAWSIAGQTSTNTRIDQQGRVTIGRDEVVGTIITVTATSWFDQTQSADAEITVT